MPDLPDAQCRLFTSPEADQAIVAAVTPLILEYCSSGGLDCHFKGLLERLGFAVLAFLREGQPSVGPG